MNTNINNSNLPKENTLFSIPHHTSIQQCKEQLYLLFSHDELWQDVDRVHLPRYT